LANRAESADIRQIKDAADLVPLLFAHTTYKTYAAEVAEFERIAAQRVADMDANAADAIDAVIASRSVPLLATGIFATLFPIAEGIRAKAHGGDDFYPDNALMVAGGLKGAVLPPNYREYVLETFNASEERLYQMYSMREINATFPLCHAGRYHISPWVMMLPLDVNGETLLDAGEAEISARAAFDHLCGQHRRVRAGCGVNAGKTLSARHFVRGVLVEGDAVRHRSRDLGADFTTPAIDLDALILPRGQLPPLLDIKLAEIIDFLVEAGERLHLDRIEYLQECLELIATTNPLPRRVVENLYREAPHFLSRQLLDSVVDANFANREELDGWAERVDPYGSKLAIRAFPPRWCTCWRETRRRGASLQSHKGRWSRRSTSSKCRQATLLRPWRCCVPWPRSTRAIPSCVPCRPSTGRAATRRSSAPCIARSTSTRLSRGAAARRSPTSSVTWDREYS
jgi:Acyl-CoA reductase (LuxC)